MSSMCSCLDTYPAGPLLVGLLFAGRPAGLISGQMGTANKLESYVKAVESTEKLSGVLFPSKAPGQS